MSDIDSHEAELRRDAAIPDETSRWNERAAMPPFRCSKCNCELLPEDDPDCGDDGCPIEENDALITVLEDAL
jgi:hypothetical protein